MTVSISEEKCTTVVKELRGIQGSCGDKRGCKRSRSIEVGLAGDFDGEPVLQTSAAGAALRL